VALEAQELRAKQEIERLQREAADEEEDFREQGGKKKARRAETERPA